MKKFHASIALAALAALPALAMSPKSGLEKGAGVVPFHPQHVAGPDKGTDACPPCSYGNAPMVQVWINGDDPANVVAIQSELSKLTKKYDGKGLKTFVIKMTRGAKDVDTARAWATKWADNVALAHIPVSNNAVKSYKINTDASVKNTVLVYVNRRISANMVNLTADAKGKKQLMAAVESVVK